MSNAVRASRFMHGNGRRIAVSFEFFPPATRGDGEDPLGVDRAAGAAGAEFRLGHLRRRRLDARAHPRDGQAHSGRDGADAGRASDLRRRHARRGRRHRAQLPRRRRAPHRGAARRSDRRRRARATRRIRAATRTPPISSPASSASAISRFRCRPIRRSIPTARRSTPTSTCSRPRSMPARRAPSRSSSSRTTSISAISTACARAASISRSCRAFCRCRTSRRRRISPRAPAPRCRRGWPSASTASTTIAATRKLIAAAVAAEQVLDLVDRGVTTFHFYTMNRADLVYAICHLLGLRPATQEVA